MVRFSRASTLGVLLWSMFSTAVLMQPALAQPGPHEQAIDAAYRAWVDAANAKDMERWASFLAPDALFLPPNRPALSDARSIKDFYADLFTDEHLSLNCQQDSVEVAQAEDMAWATGHCEITFTGPDGQATRDRSKWAKVWKRQPNGTWKCRINSWSSTQAR